MELQCIRCGVQLLREHDYPVLSFSDNSLLVYYVCSKCKALHQVTYCPKVIQGVSLIEKEVLTAAYAVS